MKIVVDCGTVEVYRLADCGTDQPGRRNNQSALLIQLLHPGMCKPQESSFYSIVRVKPPQRASRLRSGQAATRVAWHC
jgi:hypothetical protein